ncbi:site-2 protease family protein [Candidatus Micrarchaeota archaeon]|nr:site-2 protease family protein [Candidatus Micrarchaeota archaeon]
MIFLVLLIALGIFLFWAVLGMEIPGLWKFGIIFIEMVVISRILIKKYKLPNEIGLILLKSKKGIEIIDLIAARYGKIFTFMSDMGSTAAYGLLSLVITRKHTSTASMLSGFLVLFIASFLVAPMAFVFLFNVLGIGSLDESAGSVSVTLGDFGFITVAGILLLGGLFLFILAGIAFYGGFVLVRIGNYFLYGSEEILKTDPGATFLLPGINLPFFEGIIALIVVMLVHEGSHAILARIGKIPVVSSGIVLFGIIPIGAFIEPDEKKLEKSDAMKQTRVVVAGPTSNLLMSILVFIPYLGLLLLRNMFGLQGMVFDFVLITLGLTFALNFIVGAVNLLPLPLFDGYRLIDVNVRNKLIVKSLMYVTLAFFILNFLPWFFRA